MPITKADSHRNAEQTLEATDASDDLGRALRQGLNIPVCALRASMEALAREIPRHDEGRVLLRGAIEEVARIDRNVRDLVEFAEAPTLQPFASSTSEILKCALRSLPEETRARIRKSETTPGERLDVDAPLIANALRRILDNALEAGPDDVLLVARVERSAPPCLTIAVVNGETKPFEPAWATEPFHTTKPNHLGLGLTLAQRDLDLHGGELCCERLASGGTRVLLRVPIQLEPAVETEQRRGEEAA